MKKEKVVIAGGGITGLWLAHCLSAKMGETPLMVTHDLGGTLQSFSDGEFTFDHGGHVYTRADPRVTSLMKKAGAIEHKREAFYLDFDQGLIPYPVQDHVDKLGLAPYKPEFRLPEEDPDLLNLQDYAIDTFGKEFYEKWFKPFTRRVWTVDPIEMDWDWIRDRVKEPGETRENWGPNAFFYYSPGSSLISQLIKMGTFKRRMCNTIESVDIERKVLHYRDTNGVAHAIKYEILYWTLPIDRLAPKVKISASQFIHNWVRSYGIGLRNIVDYPHFNWLYPDVSSRIHRVTWLSKYHPTLSPNGKDSFLFEMPIRFPFTPYKHEIDLVPSGKYTDHRSLHREHAERIARMAGLDFIKQADIEAAAIGRVRGYPIPTIGIRNVVAEIKKRLIPYSVYTCGRWGSWGYFNIDHCMDDAEAALGASITAMADEIDPYLTSSAYYGG